MIIQTQTKHHLCLPHDALHHTSITAKYCQNVVSRELVLGLIHDKPWTLGDWTNWFDIS